MARFALLLSIIIVTSLAFWPITATLMDNGTATATEVLGMPALGASSDRFCWLSLGMGTGVLSVGLVGAGVVAITLGAGAGVLFGIGQVACGMIVIGQLGIGLVFALAQLGTGATGLGQLIAGRLVAGQLELGANGAAFLRQLREDLDKVLAFR